MASNSLIAWANYAKAAAITATSAASGMSASNVSQDQGSSALAWQTAAGVTTASLTIIPTVPAQAWGAVGIFRTNLTPSASVTFSLITLPSTTVWTSGALAGPAAGYGQVVAVPPAGTVADKLVMTIVDSTNPDGFINVPLAFGGPAWLPLVSLDWSSSFGRDDNTDEVVARGGQEFPTPRWTRKRFELRLSGIKQSEFWAKQGALDLYSRGGSNVLVIPSIVSATMQQEAVFGRLKATADVTFPNMAGDARAWAASVAERL